MVVALGTACGSDDPEETPADTTVEDTGADVADVEDGGDDADSSEEPDSDVLDEQPIQEGDLACTAEATTVSVTPTSGAFADLDIENTATIGVSVEFRGREVTEPTDFTVGCAESDIIPTGFVPMGPAFTITADPGYTRLERRFFVAAPFDMSTMPDNARPSAIRVFYRAPGSDETIQPVVMNLQENTFRGNVRFETELLGTFQIGISEQAGETRDRNWTFRAVTGISMGAGGSSTVGLRHLEEFDFIGPMGGPTDWTYIMHYIRDGGFGGFAQAPDFGNADGYEPTEQLEHNMTYDEWYFPGGEGTGGGFARSSYADIFLDLMMAFGNSVMYNPESPFLAPGLPEGYGTTPWSELCPGGDDTFTIETGLYDNEYNPDGSLPAIAFCDGYGSREIDPDWDRSCDIDGSPGPDDPNQGIYGPTDRQDVPMMITYAIDVNGNGVRDIGEPVIRNFWEPYQDVGADGLASVDEEGYDPITNPDPAGDDYDWQINSDGTEGNWLHDDGEPYDDFGLDGVDGTPQFDADGYDYGEGNGRFDYNPNFAALIDERDQRTQLARATQDALLDTTFYFDAGVRDLFNFGTATNQIVGAIQAAGGNFRVYDDFYSVEDLPEEDRDFFSFNNVDYENLGQNVYVRYGNLDASAEDICYGDGKHAGTVPQVANRILVMLGYILNRFPEPDLEVIEAPYPLPNGTYFAPASDGSVIKYSIVLPPGYERTQCSDGADNDGDGRNDGFDTDCASAESTSEAGDPSITRCNDGIDNDDDGVIDGDDPECASGDGLSEWAMDSPFRVNEFPVVYLMHGYGMTPDDLKATALPFAGFMAGGTWPKAIVVYPDGYCGEIEITQCSDGIDNDGDGIIDTDDEGCGGNRRGRSESGDYVAYCDDGVDNDLDGLTDLDDRGCDNSGWDNEANCVSGNFYTNHVAWPAGGVDGPAYEDIFFELIDHIDETYRVRDEQVFPEIID